MAKKEHRTFVNYMRSGTAEDFKTDFQTPVPVAKYMVSLLPKRNQKGERKLRK
jgi:hypothetical protein